MTGSSLSIYKEEPWNNPSALGYASSRPESPAKVKDIPDGSDELKSVLCEMYAEMEIERRMAANIGGTRHQTNLNDEPEINIEICNREPTQNSKSFSRIVDKTTSKTNQGIRPQCKSYSIMSSATRAPLKPISKWRYNNGAPHVYRHRPAMEQRGTRVAFSTKTKHI